MRPTPTPKPDPTSSPARPRLRLLGMAAFVVVVSLFVATILTLSNTGESFWVNLLDSMCIGFAIFGWALLLHQLVRLWRRLRGLGPGRAGVVVYTVLAAPLGYVTGYGAAMLLQGHAPEFVELYAHRGMAIPVTVLASTLVVTLVWLRDRLAHEAAARAQAQRLAAEAQLRLLRAQLEPHMLFNTLANLRSLVEIDVPASQRMIDQLITYLRSTLAASRHETTTLQEEYAQLRAYLEIMALRMGERLSFALELPDTLMHTPIPPMLLQPLVENAIQHGVERQVGPAQVAVAAAREGEMIRISVTDSGPGLPAESEAPLSPARVGGYGIEHVRERLLAVYGGRASLRLDNLQPRGLRATVTVPATLEPPP